MSIRTTPLYDRHIALRGKMVDFAGYRLPIQYSGIVEEHMAVREHAGLFDVSHMGEFFLCGKDAPALLETLFSNSFLNLSVDRARYTLLLNDRGGVVDDLIVYRLAPDRFMLVVNAANREKDFATIQSHLYGDVSFEDRSDDTSLLALQGPRSFDILSKLTDGPLPLRPFSAIQDCKLLGVPCLVSQTGYTGEAGFEIYCPAANAPDLWDAILAAGETHGIRPAGLGARDTLRMEAGMPLYGHEIDEDISPSEAVLDFAVKMDKPDFIGKDALLSIGIPPRVRVGLKITSRGIARDGALVFSEDQSIGRVTSGTFLPFLGGAYAMATVDRAYCDAGTTLSVLVRDKKLDAVVLPLPFYQRKKDQ